MKTLHPRVTLFFVVCLALVLTMCFGRAHAADDGTRVFTWSGTPAGTKYFKLLCDGQTQIGQDIPANALTWTAPPGTWPADSTHGCHLESAQAAGVVRPVTNSVTITIPPAVVVVPPPVPFTLTVQSLTGVP